MDAFLLSPACKDYLWGGTRLISEYHKKTDLPRLAESWELSAHPDGDCAIAGGALAGIPFSSYVKQYPQRLGKKMQAQEDFPLLIKLIDARQNLSVQVHPDEDYARRVEGQHGKTELWYILDCAPGAFLYLGWERTVSRREVAAQIRAGTVTRLLRREPVKKGDVFFIPAGTVHALGAGIVLAEIQQSSNATYRVWDYGRLDERGEPRALHLEKALDVMDLHPYARERSAAPAAVQEDALLRRLVSCPYFTVDCLQLSGSWSAAQDTGSFISLLCVEGSGTLCLDQDRMWFKKGDSLLIPAGEALYSVSGKAELILSRL